MMKTRIYLLPFVWIFLIAACDQVEMMNTDTIKPVVECYLCADSSVTMKVSTQQLFTEEESDSLQLSGLNITLTTPSLVESLKETSVGTYKSASTFVEAGGTYSMSFRYNGKTVSASTLIPQQPIGMTVSKDTIYTVSSTSAGAVSPTTTVTVSWSNPSEAYYQVVLINIEENPKNINSNYTASRYIRFSTTTGSSISFNDRSFRYYGRHRVVLTALNTEYVEMLNDMNGNSNNLQSPSTNVTNGTGIFTGTNADERMITILPK